MLDKNGQDDHDHRSTSGLNYDEKADIVRLLLECGADVATYDGTHSTPLHLASYSWSPEAIRLLIEHGAHVTAQDISNRTPLHLALSKSKNVSSNSASLSI